jgi:hypothetical protein
MNGYTGEYEAEAGTTVSEYGDGVAAQTSELNAITKKRVFEQASEAQPGQFDPRTLNILIGKGGDVASTLLAQAHPSESPSTSAWRVAPRRRRG